MFAIPIEFAYLVLALGFGLVWTFFFLWFPMTRRIVFKVSFLAGFGGLVIEQLYFRDFWNPASFANVYVSMVVDKIPVGTARFLPEDFLFAFFFMGVTGMLAHVTGKHLTELRLNAPSMRQAHRAIIMFVIVIISLVLILAGLSSFFATSLTFLMVAWFFVWAKRDSWKYGLYCGGATAALMFVALSFGLNIVSGPTNSQHILEATWFLYGIPWWGATFLNVPVILIFWAFCWGSMVGAGRNYAFG